MSTFMSKLTPKLTPKLRPKSIPIGVLLAPALGLCSVPAAYAGIEEVPGLTEAQTNAAIAVEAIYSELSSRSALTDEEQALFEGAEEIVHTGNQILNALLGASEPIERSLNLNEEGFAGVLQWVTHEEISAQGKLSGEAIGAQSSNIGARMDALRLGARGFQLAWNVPAQPTQSSHVDQYGGLAMHEGGLGLDGRQSGGNAGGENANLPGWGAFLNGGAGAGNRDPSDREDAFDFDLWSLTGGVDYRLMPDWVVGVALGLSESQVDFDGAKSIVEGQIKTQAWLLSAFSSYQWQDVYVDASLSYGQSDFDLERRISYPSQNVLIAATNELALADTRADLLNLSIQSGWILNWANWTFGPTLGLDYVLTDIDAYTETNAGEFNLSVEAQSIDGLTSRLGGRVQWALSHRRGVLVPQLDLEWVHEFSGASRQVGAKFADDSSDNYFDVLTDAPDADFAMLGLSLSALFQNGLQGFVAYKTTLALDNISSDFITGGLRWEF
jgi:uncharacterized protein YhjY with autotransporter beta-barrel domain